MIKAEFELSFLSESSRRSEATDSKKFQKIPKPRDKIYSCTQCSKCGCRACGPRFLIQFGNFIWKCRQPNNCFSLKIVNEIAKEKNKNVESGNYCYN